MERQAFISRRQAMAAAVIAGVGMGAVSSAIARGADRISSGVFVETAQYEWAAEPEEAPATQHTFTMRDGTKLWGWDTGGDGPAVLLMHAYTGSAATWAYQQRDLADAGYRVIAYSRRGHYLSERGPEDATGHMIGDMAEVLAQLGVDKVHLLGTAAGGFSVFDFALSYPDRLLSLTLASSLGGVEEPDFLATTQALLPPGWHDLPATFRELGPSYRAANPAGAQRWAELEEQALPGGRINQAKANAITWSALHTIATPALVMTGDADLYFPPSRMRQVAAHLPNCRTAIIAEAGHAAFWEQPAAFNRQLLSHFAASVVVDAVGAA